MFKIYKPTCFQKLNHKPLLIQHLQIRIINVKLYFYCNCRLHRCPWLDLFIIYITEEILIVKIHFNDFLIAISLIFVEETTNSRCARYKISVVVYDVRYIEWLHFKFVVLKRAVALILFVEWVTIFCRRIWLIIQLSLILSNEVADN